MRKWGQVQVVICRTTLYFYFGHVILMKKYSYSSTDLGYTTQLLPKSTGRAWRVWTTHLPVKPVNGWCMTPMTGLPLTATQTIVVTYLTKDSGEQEKKKKKFKGRVVGSRFQVILGYQPKQLVFSRNRDTFQTQVHVHYIRLIYLAFNLGELIRVTWKTCWAKGPIFPDKNFTRNPSLRIKSRLQTTRRPNLYIPAWHPKDRSTQ